MSKITNDSLTRSGTAYFLTSGHSDAQGCTQVATASGRQRVWLAVDQNPPANRSAFRASLR